MFIPLGVLWGLTLWLDVARALGDDLAQRQASRWLPGYDALARPFLGTALLLPLAFLVFVVRLGRFRRRRPRQDRRPDVGNR